MKIEYKDNKKVPFNQLEPGQTFIKNGKVYIKAKCPMLVKMRDFVSQLYASDEFAVNLNDGSALVFICPDETVQVCRDKVQVCNAKVIVED